MYALERPPHLSSAALDDVQSPRIRALHVYWQSKCNDVVPPPRSAIEPADIRPLLPYLVLTELHGGAVSDHLSVGRHGGGAMRMARTLPAASTARSPSLTESGIDESYRTRAGEPRRRSSAGPPSMLAINPGSVSSTRSFR